MIPTPRATFLFGVASAAIVPGVGAAAETLPLKSFAASGSAADSIAGKQGISCLAFSADGRHLASSSFGGLADLFTSDGRHLASLYPAAEAQQRGQIFRIRFNADSSLVGTVHYDGSVGVTHVNGKRESQYIVDSAAVLDVAFARTGPGYFVVSDNGSLRHERPDGTIAWTVFRAGCARALAASPDATLLAFTNDAGELWLVRSGGEVVKRVAHGQGRQEAVCFHPHLRRILIAGRSGTATIWDYDGNRIARLGVPGGPWISSATFTPDGERVCMTDLAGELSVMATSGTRLASFRVPGSVFGAVACAPHARTVAVGDQRGVVNVFPLPAS
jgi:WD40 repeat protein